MSIISVKELCLWYGDHQALRNVNIEIPEKSITAFIGPSGCGRGRRFGPAECSNRRRRR